MIPDEFEIRKVFVGRYNHALRQLQLLEGTVSFAKILPIIQAFQNQFVPPECGGEGCPSDTPLKSSSPKSETEQ